MRSYIPNLEAKFGTSDGFMLLVSGPQKAICGRSDYKHQGGTWSPQANGAVGTDPCCRPNTERWSVTGWEGVASTPAFALLRSINAADHRDALSYSLWRPLDGQAIRDLPRGEE